MTSVGSVCSRQLEFIATLHVHLSENDHKSLMSIDLGLEINYNENVGSQTQSINDEDQVYLNTTSLGVLHVMMICGDTVQIIINAVYKGVIISIGFSQIILTSEVKLEQELSHCT